MPEEEKAEEIFREVAIDYSEAREAERALIRDALAEKDDRFRNLNHALQTLIVHLVDVVIEKVKAWDAGKY